MSNLDTLSESRLQKLLVRVIDLTSGENSECLALGYHADKELIDKFLGTSHIQDHTKKHKGFAFQLDKLSKTICYDDSLPLDKRLEVFAHEAGHCLLGHLSPSSSDLKKISNREKSQQEWEADFFSAMFLFVADGALPILKSWDREHIYTKLEGGDC